MAELLTRQIVYEYQKRLKALPEYGNQDNQGLGKVHRRA